MVSWKLLRNVGVSVATFLVAQFIFSLIFSTFKPGLNVNLPASSPEEPPQQEKSLKELLSVYETRLKLVDIPSHKEPVFLPGATCLSNVPHRIQRGSTGGKNLPLYVFVAGLEGSGHRIFNEVFKALEKHMPITYITPADNFHNADEQQSIIYRYGRIDLEEHFHKIRDKILEPFSKNSIMVDHLSSFPFGGKGGSLHQPDLLHLIQLDGVLFDLRVIMLHRDPFAAIKSAVRETLFEAEQATGPEAAADVAFKSLEYQTRVTEETLAYLNNAMLYVACEQQLWIDFECIQHDPQQYFSKLASFLHVPEEYFSHLPAQLPYKEHYEHFTFHGEDLATVEEFLHNHKDLWPHMALRPSCKSKD